jgi:hypothetical protein
MAGGFLPCIMQTNKGKKIIKKLFYVVYLVYIMVAVDF